MFQKKSIISCCSRLFLYLGISLILLWTIVPIVWLILTSIKPFRLYFGAWWAPFRPTGEHYFYLFFERNVFHFFLNSLIITVVSTALALTFAIFMGYGLARYRFKGNVALLFIILLTRMYPPVTTVIPWYVFAMKFRLVDSHILLIIIYSTFQMSLATWTMRVFFQNIPRELEESAKIDGCSNLGALIRISLPLVVPGLIAAGVILFIFSWNHYMFALVLTTSKAKTLPVAVYEFQDPQTLTWGRLSAIGTITILPMLLLGVFVLKYLVRGMTFGAVKG